DHRHRTIFVVERLLAGTQIDDAQPTMTERDALVEVIPARIRTAMRQGRGHPLDARIGVGRPPVAIVNTGDTTHVIGLYRLESCWLPIDRAATPRRVVR